MPIITYTEAKQLLQLTDDTYETLIGALIPLVQNDIVEYTNNSFLNPNCRIEGSTISFAKAPEGGQAIISDSDSGFVDAGFVAGDYKIYGSKYNDKIVQVETVSAGSLVLVSSETLDDETAENSIVITRVNWPANIKLKVAQLISYYINKQGKLVKSESLPSGYSATFKDNAEIMKPFDLYRKPYK